MRRSRLRYSSLLPVYAAMPAILLLIPQGVVSGPSSPDAARRTRVPGAPAGGRLAGVSRDPGRTMDR